MDKQRTYPLLPEDKCLSEQQLFDYIDGKLSVAEMHVAEKHVLDCEMCSDALEGFEIIKNREKVASLSPDKIVKEVIAENEPKIIPLFSSRKTIYAIAASVVLILGIGVVMKMNLASDNESTKLAENSANGDHSIISNGDLVSGKFSDSISTTSPNELKDEQKNLNGPSNSITSTETPRKIENAYARGDNNQGIVFYDAESQADGSGLANAKPVLAAADKAQDIAPATDEYKPDNSNLGFSTNDKSVVDSKESASKKDKTKNEGIKFSNRSSDAMSKTSSTPAPPTVNSGAVNQTSVSGGVSRNGINEKANQTTTMSTDSTSYVVGNAEEISVTDDVTTEDYRSLSYENGLKLLNAGQAAASITFFDEVLKDEKHIHFQDAQWEKSIALLQLNRTAEAKVLLNDIVKKNGKYKSQAQEKLKTL